MAQSLSAALTSDAVLMQPNSAGERPSAFLCVPNCLP